MKRSAHDGERTVLTEAAFQRMMSVERKRTERSRKPFLLMLLDVSHSGPNSGRVLSQIISTLLATTRETDVVGLYKEHSMVGVMLTELKIDEQSSIQKTMLARVIRTLRHSLSSEQMDQIAISFHVFPDRWDHDSPRGPGNPALYPDLATREKTRKWFSALKRTMDITGSLVSLVVSAPIFLAVALAIKLSSKGPIFFRQERVGQRGRRFIFLKFRSMYVDNDASVHKEYVRRLIAGQAKPEPSRGKGVYKLTQDSRITPLGSLLRRTSLDELPQLFNVLKGEMSLVGPRPPLPYEVEAYEIWHRRRLIEAKPGITGLWQVNGRSRVKFDDMVRLDLLYAKTWSPWLDVKILLRTPRAVIEGAH
jgi:lipopolysaccharide/colanic/teichoic acid biosynthesis glycosyltransferase